MANQNISSKRLTWKTKRSSKNEAAALRKNHVGRLCGLPFVLTPRALFRQWRANDSRTFGATIDENVGRVFCEYPVTRAIHEGVSVRATRSNDVRVGDKTVLIVEFCSKGPHLWTIVGTQYRSGVGTCATFERRKELRKVFEYVLSQRELVDVFGDWNGASNQIRPPSGVAHVSSLSG